MDATSLVGLYLFSFGALAYSTLTIIQIKERRAVGSGCDFWAPLGLNLLCAFWFFLLLAVLFPEVRSTPVLGQALRIALLGTVYLFPPFICGMFYVSYRDAFERKWPWKAGLAGSALLTSLFLLLWGLSENGVWIESSGVLISRLAITGGFIYAGGFAFAVMRQRHQSGYVHRPEVKEASEEPTKPGFRRWFLVLFLIAIVFPWAAGSLGWAGAVQLITGALPLSFLVVSLYYYEKYHFFDLVVKRGLFFFVVLGMLLAFFVLVAPLIEATVGVPHRPLVYTLAALPMALSIPFVFRRMEVWLDRIWLGRHYEPIDAAKHFLFGTRESLGRVDLLKKAQRVLEEIFEAPIRIQVRGESPVGHKPAEELPETSLEVPIRMRGSVKGWIRLGPRRNGMPYFSGDTKLVTALADVLAHLLQNVQLQQERKEQEQLEKDLRLHASQSELKALRAQINPHFLFNALNAIAALISKDPERAEVTVEQLAEVFRYTLTRSEKEWVRFGDEIDFVRAYLEVEKARFGERLSVDIRISDESKDVRMPAMIVQTLVENAVKHGISNRRGKGRLTILASTSGEIAHIEVGDDGPGFELEAGLARTSTGPGGLGFGLKSVARRLAGYYGERGQISVTRDEGRGLNVVSLEFPIKAMALKDSPRRA